MSLEGKPRVRPQVSLRVRWYEHGRETMSSIPGLAISFFEHGKKIPNPPAYTLIRSAKCCLRKMIQQETTYDKLLTAVIEVEGILNSQHLSYLSSDDMEEPLSPSHLHVLAGQRLLNLPDGFGHRAEEVENTPEALTRRMKHLNYASNQFWTFGGKSTFSN